MSATIYHLLLDHYRAEWITRDKESPAFGIFAREIKLKEFDQPTSKQVVINYLNSARLNPDPSSIFPFEESALEAIIQRSAGIPRQLNDLCSKTLDAAIDLDIEQIDEKSLRICLYNAGEDVYKNLQQNEQYFLTVIHEHGGILTSDDRGLLQELGAMTIYEIYPILEGLVQRDALTKKETVRGVEYRIAPLVAEAMRDKP